jgi:Uncharacterized conserved protein
MKIAVTAGGTGLEDCFDTRFGRAAYFIVYDLDNDSWESHANTQNLEAAQGAGIQAAQTVQRLGVSAVITGHVGPKAYKVLDANGTKIFMATARTVKDAVTAYKNGSLSLLAVPDVEGHWV